jgi:hypothetical protein
MRSHAVAEWIVGRFTNKSRAASILGDLEELKPQKGRLWFWLSFVRVVFSLAWRRPIAFVAAVLATFVWVGGDMSLVVPIWRSHAYKLPDHRWMFASNVLSTIGTVLLTVLMYSAIRYGFRDGLTRLALVLTPIVAAAVIYCWWQSAVLAVSILVGILVAAAYIANKQRIREVLAFTIVIVVGSAGSVLASRLWSLYLHLIHGKAEVRAHPSAIWVSLCISLCELLLTTLLVTIACSRTHGWLMAAQRLDSEIDSSR